MSSQWSTGARKKGTAGGDWNMLNCSINGGTFNGAVFLGVGSSGITAGTFNGLCVSGSKIETNGIFNSLLMAFAGSLNPGGSTYNAPVITEAVGPFALSIDASGNASLGPFAIEPKAIGPFAIETLNGVAVALGPFAFTLANGLWSIGPYSVQ